MCIVITITIITLSHSCFSFASTDEKYMYMYLNSMSSRNTKTDKILTLWKIYVRFKLTEGGAGLPVMTKWSG